MFFPVIDDCIEIANKNKRLSNQTVSFHYLIEFKLLFYKQLFFDYGLPENTLCGKHLYQVASGFQIC